MTQIIQNPLSLSGSITVHGSISGSFSGSLNGVLFGNATTATSTTFAETASYLTATPATSSYSSTASYAQAASTSTSASYARSASFARFAVTPPAGDSSNKIVTTEYLSSQLGGVDASTLPFTPMGGISATTIQGAIEQVDTQKLGTTGGTMTGYLNLPASPISPNQASNKSYVDTAIVSASLKSAQVVYNPQGNITSSNVGTAISELDAEKVSRAGDSMTGYLTLHTEPLLTMHATTKGYVDSAIDVRIANSPIANSASAGQAPVLDGMGLLDASTIPNTVVKSINNILPDTAGNVAISLTTVEVGTLAARPTASLDGTMYVVSGDSTPSNNGQTFIYASGSWHQTAYLDTAFYDTRYLSLNGGTLSGSLYVPATPVGGAHVTNKYYVDNRIASASYQASSILVIPTGNISSINAQAALEELDTDKLSLAGGTMTGYLTLISDPVSDMHAATKNYVDSTIANQPITLDSLLDVSASNAVAEDVLYYDGLRWVNGNPPNQAYRITSTPVGAVTATTVQAAISQLNNLIVSKSFGTLINIPVGLVTSSTQVVALLNNQDLTLDSATGTFTGSLLGTAATASYFSGSISNAVFANSSTSASYAETASYVLGSIESASYAATAATASYWSGSIENANSASFANFASTASLATSASWAPVQISSSFASTASYWSGSIENANSASYSEFAVSASYWSGSIQNSLSSSYAESASFATTASYWSGSIENANSASFANFASTASYWSGSIENANSSSYSEFAVSASWAPAATPIDTSSFVTNDMTASLSVAYALTASYALNAGGGTIDTSSFVTAAQTASMTVLSASYAANVQVIDTGSFVTAAQTSSMTVESASYAVSASWAPTQTIDTSSFITMDQTASMSVATASYWSGSIENANSSSYANSASFATTASFARSSSFTTTASFATTASWANSSSYSDKSSHTENVLLYVQNNSGADIPKGSVVILSGSSGDNPRIQLADYSTERRSAYTIGFTNEPITNGGNGYVITEGRLVGVNTNAFTGGDLLYLGASGSYTNIEPQAPFHTVRLGQVIRVQTNNGSIDVRIDNGYELDELHDVRIISASHGQTIARSGSVWINTNTLNITGSVQGTASFATTASYVLGSIESASYAETASYVLGSIESASYAEVANSLNTLNQNVTITGSLLLSGSVNNIVIGRGAGDDINNIAIGTTTNLQNNTVTGVDSGRYNTAIGVAVLETNTTGYGNTGVGFATQVNNSAGVENTSLGFQPLFFDSQGNRNTAIGARALYILGNSQITSQNDNTALGAYAASSISQASASIFIGRSTNPASNGQTNQIVIGTNAVGNGSNTTTIGNLNTVRTILRGVVSGSSFTGSFTGSLQGTASFAISSSRAISSSFALTASYALNGGGAAAFPFTGSAGILGSLLVNGNMIQGTATNTVNSTGSHAEGQNTSANGNYSHAEGQNTNANGFASHAEGAFSTAAGQWSHAEGVSTGANGFASHAEGFGNQANGIGAHAEGNASSAIGDYSHAEGQETFAFGQGSHTEGYVTVAVSEYQHVQGVYNLPISASGAFILGNGANADNKSNLIFASGSQVQITGSLQVSGSINNVTLDNAAWTSYTPFWRAQTTNPVIGNGTITGAYKVIGKTCFVRVKLNFGSSTTFGSGAWLIGLPLTASTADGVQMPVSMLDQNNAWYQGILNGTYQGSTTGSAIIAQSTASNSSQGVHATFPFAWGTADSLQFAGSYEIA